MTVWRATGAGAGGSAIQRPSRIKAGATTRAPTPEGIGKSITKATGDGCCLDADGGAGRLARPASAGPLRGTTVFAPISLGGIAAFRAGAGMANGRSRAKEKGSSPTRPTVVPGGTTVEPTPPSPLATVGLGPFITGGGCAYATVLVSRGAGSTATPATTVSTVAVRTGPATSSCLATPITGSVAALARVERSP